MGSLVAGWASPIMDEQKARARRNNSLTKEEINHFYKTQKKTNGEDHESEDFTFSPYGSRSGSPAFLTDEEKRKAASPFSRSYKDSYLIDRMQSGQNSPRIVESAEQDDQKETGKPDKTGDWWTKSNWAFLNEPPRDDVNGVASKYTPQFDVAKLATGTA